MTETYSIPSGGHGSKRRARKNSQDDNRTGKRLRRGRKEEDSPSSSATSAPFTIGLTSTADENAILEPAREQLQTYGPDGQAASPQVSNMVVALLALMPGLDGTSGIPYDTCFGVVSVESCEFITLTSVKS